MIWKLFTAPVYYAPRTVALGVADLGNRRRGRREGGTRPSFVEVVSAAPMISNEVVAAEVMPQTSFRPT